MLYFLFIHEAIITSLAKEVMFSVVFVCLSVCLFATLLTKVTKWIAMKFYEGSGVVKGTSD